MKSEFIHTAKVLLDIQQKIKYLKEQERKAAETLREICGNDSQEFEGYKYQRIERLGSIQYKDIPELKSIDLEQYRGNPVTSWKLSFAPQFKEVLDAGILCDR